MDLRFQQGAHECEIRGFLVYLLIVDCTSLLFDGVGIGLFLSWLGLFMHF